MCIPADGLVNNRPSHYLNTPPIWWSKTYFDQNLYMYFQFAILLWDLQWAVYLLQCIKSPSGWQPTWFVTIILVVLFPPSSHHYICPKGIQSSILRHSTSPPPWIVLPRLCDVHSFASETSGLLLATAHLSHGSHPTSVLHRLQWKPLPNATAIPRVLPASFLTVRLFMSKILTVFVHSSRHLASVRPVHNLL